MLLLRCLCNCCCVPAVRLTLVLALALEDPLELKPPADLEPVSRYECSASEGSDDRNPEPSSTGEKGGDTTSGTADRVDADADDKATDCESKEKRGTTVGDSGDMSFDDAASADEEETGVVKGEGSALAWALALPRPLPLRPTAPAGLGLEEGAMVAAAGAHCDDADDDDEDADDGTGAWAVVVVVWPP